jgi:phage terminase large subunit-like protein
MPIKITLEQVQAEIDRRKHNKFDYWFPDTGVLRRDLYVKHLEFFAAGAEYRERCMMAANRVGKTEGCGAYEATCHLTGVYPHWWVGRRFKTPVRLLAAGETGKLVRDSVQAKLMGPPSDIGSGLIPLHTIVDKRSKSGIPDAYDVVYIKHVSGGTSVLQFQSYDQGREAFQATERDVIWLDEEPPIDIYSECLIRTMTTGGIVMSTFTPLKGVSDTVLSLQDKAEKGICKLVYATWDDAPHLTQKDKDELFLSLPVHQRDARSKGIPALGSGAVFQVPESDIKCEPFEIPKHFKRLYGLDVGWNNTAACWGAFDPETETIYVVDVYKRGQCEPANHASAIKQRGEWQKGVIDPASRGRTQNDGQQLISLYRVQGLNLSLADNAVEAGVFDVYERMATGRFKIFSTCGQFFEEYRLYRRDEKGKIVKQNDHIMDACRYMTRSIIELGLTKPLKDDYDYGDEDHYEGRSSIGGY